MKHWQPLFYFLYGQRVDILSMTIKVDFMVMIIEMILSWKLKFPENNKWTKMLKCYRNQFNMDTMQLILHILYILLTSLLLLVSWISWGILNCRDWVFCFSKLKKRFSISFADIKVNIWGKAEWKSSCTSYFHHVYCI